MAGALDLTEPCHLLAKLEHEFEAVAADNSNSYAAINALRDAYHLREWVWHGRLENDRALQAMVMNVAGKEDDWNKYVNQQFPDFSVVRELCNGSKHFVTGNKIIQGTHRAGWDSPVAKWDVAKWDDKGLYVEVGGRFVSVVDLLTSVREFWRRLFAQFPQLG
jgi:hypothetical protein